MTWVYGSFKSIEGKKVLSFWSLSRDPFPCEYVKSFISGDQQKRCCVEPVPHLVFLLRNILSPQTPDYHSSLNWFSDAALQQWQLSKLSFRQPQKINNLYILFSVLWSTVRNRLLPNRELPETTKKRELTKWSCAMGCFIYGWTKLTDYSFSWHQVKFCFYAFVYLFISIFVIVGILNVTYY